MSIHLCVSAAEFKAILYRDSSTVLSLRLSSHRQTRRIGSEYIFKLLSQSEFVHKTKSPGPKRRVGVAREERSRKRDEHNVCKYYKSGVRISCNVFPLK